MQGQLRQPIPYWQIQQPDPLDMERVQLVRAGQPWEVVQLEGRPPLVASRF